jgi:dTDP-4-amino-4,6-dideoxygalactose transaminase
MARTLLLLRLSYLITYRFTCMAGPIDETTAGFIPYEWPGSYYLGEEEIAAATEVLRSRSPYRFYGHDPKRYAERLEAAFARRLGRRHALAVSSGTAALSVAMGALSIGPGDEVLLPGYFWVACAGAVVRAGAIPPLVDVDDTFCMDPADLRRKIGPYSRAVMLIHMSGAPGAVEEIAAICRERGLYLIEDCAQANGARFRGRPVGAFGDIATFSFQVNKNITAGEGGLVVCDDDLLHRRAWACHDMGYPRNPEGRLDASDPECQLWGQGTRYAELLAAVVNAQLGKLDDITSAMRQRKYALKRKLENVPGLAFRRIIDSAGDSGAFLLMIWPDRGTCLRMVERTRAAGIRTGEAGVNNIPMTDWGLHIYYNNTSLVQKRSLTPAGRPWSDPLNAFATEYSYGRGALPVLDDLVSRSSLLSIPPVLSEKVIDRIASEFRRAARGGRTSMEALASPS